MLRRNQFVQKIQEPYVGEDCVQVMIPYKKEIVMLNENGILLSDKKGSSIYQNRYVDDERRFQFPYSNIPIHYSSVPFFRKKIYANQLLEFDKPYIRLADSIMIESFAVKDQKEAFIMNQLIPSTDSKTMHMTRGELDHFFHTASTTAGTYVISLNPDLCQLNLEENTPLATEDEIREFLKKDIKDCIAQLNAYIEKDSSKFCSPVSDFFEDHPWFLNYIEQEMDPNRLDLINTCLELNGGHRIIVDFPHQLLQEVYVVFIEKDHYVVAISEFPINHFTLEQLKNQSSKIVNVKEPRIPLQLNPGISKQEIKEAKQMVKTLRR